MKTLAILSALCLSLAASAGQECAVIGCKILLEKGEFTHHEGKVYIKGQTMEEIFNTPNAWVIDYHVFIYVECEWCGAPHPIDYACTNPNCRGKLR